MAFVENSTKLFQKLPLPVGEGWGEGALNSSVCKMQVIVLVQYSLPHLRNKCGAGCTFSRREKGLNFMLFYPFAEACIAFSCIFILLCNQKYRKMIKMGLVFYPFCKSQVERLWLQQKKILKILGK